MRHQRLVPTLVVLLLSLIVVIGFSQMSGVKAETQASYDYNGLLNKAAQQGTVRVIATLKGRFLPEGQLDVAATQNQRMAIQQAQGNVLATLATQKGTYHVITQFIIFPLISLEVDHIALQTLIASPYVAAVQEDELSSPTDLSSNNVIGAPSAWAAGYDGTGWTVGILDTGVQTTHPFFTGKIDAEACFSTTSAANSSVTLCPNGQSTSGSTPGMTGTGSGVNCDIAIDGCEHGTHVAGIAAGKDYSGGPGYSGVGRGAHIIAIQVFSKFTTSTNCGAVTPCVLSYTNDQLAALQYVYTTLRVGRSIASLNMSLGGSTKFTSACDTNVLKSAVDNLRSVNIATVIAAGNNGFTDGLSSPACISTAISVGATNDSDGVASFSNRASFMSLYAPGVSIDSSVPNNTFANLQGTSMAAPHVAGAWAVVMQKYPSATVSDILNALRTTGVGITNSGFTVPRIQVNAAVGVVVPTATVAPTNTPVTVGQLVQDGGFELGTGGPWTQTSTNFGSPLCDASCGGVGPRTGSWWAWFGGAGTAAETGTLTQTGIVPNSPQQLNFYLWWSSGATDPSATFKVYMDGNVIFSLAYPGTGYTSGYTLATVNISAYSNGGSHTLKFEQINAASSGSTNIHMDDVFLSPIISSTATPTASKTPTITPSVTPSATPSRTPSATATGTGAAPHPDTIGIFRSSAVTFYMRNSNTTGFADSSITFGASTDFPITGDWNGDGIDTAGVYRQSTGQFFLTDSTTNPAVLNYSFTLGNPNDQPIVGDWDGNGTDGVGVFRPSNGLIYLKNNLTTGFADFTMVLGIPGDVGIAGDWDGNGSDSPGVYRPSNQQFYLTNSICNCSVFADIQLGLGIAGDTPFVGDWDGNGVSGIGVYRQSNGLTYIKNALTTGFADASFVFGSASDYPLAGYWVRVGGGASSSEPAPTFQPK
ncbi:MAG: S8 family serine peptidase [Anaerolineae bacterium]|nr:S8 family serine peptidase [Anaerolineae bacterium]